MFLSFALYVLSQMQYDSTRTLTTAGTGKIHIYNYTRDIQSLLAMIVSPLPVLIMQPSVDWHSLFVCYPCPAVVLVIILPSAGSH